MAADTCEFFFRLLHFFFLLSCHFSALPHFFPFFIFFSHWCFVIKSIISLFVLFDCVFLVLFYVVFFLSFFSCICCIVFCIVILENAKIDDANCFIHKFSQFSVLIHQPHYMSCRFFFSSFLFHSFSSSFVLRYLFFSFECMHLSVHWNDEV